MVNATKRKVLDWSNYTGIPSQAKIKELIADGWAAVILGTQNPSIARQQKAACDKAGLRVDALYCFVYWDDEDIRRLNDAISLADEFGVLVWLDCEWTHTSYPGTGTWCPAAPQLVQLIHQYVEHLAEKFQGIYTGEWWWPIYTNDCGDFHWALLWHAAYSQPDFEGFQPYGLWKRPFLWQFSSQGTDGITADLNVQDEDVVPAPPVPAPVVRTWLYGGEEAGLERRGFQQFWWNNATEVDALGDWAGEFPGQHWHNEGGVWIQAAV